MTFSTNSSVSTSYGVGEPSAALATRVTGVELYRIGDMTGPGLEKVRPGIDISVVVEDGVDWVEGTPKGGASARSSMYALRRHTSRWWRLPKESRMSSQLTIRNDHGHHWLIEPATDMRVAEYRALLRELGGLFVCLTTSPLVSG